MKLKQYIKQSMKAVLPAGLLALSACGYLDVIPPAQPDFEDTMQDESSTLGFLFTAYKGTTDASWWSESTVSNAADDFLRPQDWDYSCHHMLYGTVSSNTDDGQWETLYNYIGYVHYFLEWLEQLNPSGVTEEGKAQLRAEAWFLEAFYHFKVLTHYGPCPIIETKVDQNILPEDIPGRSHFDYCIDWIVGKLDAAAEILPETRATEDLGRADATICKALKARVLLYAASPLWNGSFYDRNWKNTNYETPGYGYQLRHGATTLTEQWDPNQGSSLNHFMMGQIDEWLFKTLAGIQNQPGTHGLRHLLIAPTLVGDLQYVKASTASLYGRISVDCSRTQLTVEIPVGSDAVIVLPDGQKKQVGSGRYTFNY